MVKSYTAKYTKIDSGYMGQLIEWPEVVTEGHGIEECRSMLRGRPAGDGPGLSAGTLRGRPATVRHGAITIIGEMLSGTQPR